MNTVHGRNKLCRIVQNFHGAKFLQIGKMQNFATTKCLVIVTGHFNNEIFHEKYLRECYPISEIHKDFAK